MHAIVGSIWLVGSDLDLDIVQMLAPKNVECRVSTGVGLKVYTETPPVKTKSVPIQSTPIYYESYPRYYRSRSYCPSCQR